MHNIILLLFFGGFMAKGQNQKLKLLYLAKILYEHTDDRHGLTMPEILSFLREYGVSAERKRLYTDIEDLCRFGLDVIKEKRNRKCYYYLGNRSFELAELKLLVDSVQSSKFITAKKSNELINKIESLTSKYEAKQLQRQVFVAGRVKTMNESIYYNVDKIHTAINDNLKISFHYFQWNVNKNIELRHDGKMYEISPWALTWAEENYYLIGYDSEVEQIKHYRVDKMLHIEVGTEQREGEEYFSKFDMAVYSKRIFGMFDGKSEIVKIECENKFAGVIIDRFGKNVNLIKQDDEHFTVNVDVAVSDHFLGWIIALGTGVKIVSPNEVVKKMKQRIDELQSMYSEL